MTTEQLRALIAGGETLDVEFKGEEHGRLSDGDLVEAVVCMSNRPGSQAGWVLVGVEDDGRVTGARPRHEAGKTDMLRVQALIANRTRPSVSVRAELVPHPLGAVLAIDVPSSPTAVGTADGRYARRALGHDGKPECVPYHYHEMLSRQADRGGLDYSAMELPNVTWADLDPLEFDRYRRAIRESKGQGDATLLTLSDKELAKALGAVSESDGKLLVRVVGLLLFGKLEPVTYTLPTHEVASQVLSGTKVEANDFFRFPLLRAMEELLSRFRARNREEELLVGMLRVGVPDYPEKAFREAVANALIHRDYTRLGAVHVQWHEDRVEVSNPGGFPEGVTLSNLLVTDPRPRNPLLADAFKRAGIVERTGRGIDTIFWEQLSNGRPAPIYGRSTATSVVLVLPGGKANLEFVRLVSEESKADRPLKLDELLVLNELAAQRSLTSDEAAALTQKSQPEARVVLEHLTEAGLVEPRGERKGRVYQLSARIYKRLGLSAAYIRQRGFEPEQQEHMVLQYVRKHGRITRHEVADLCRVNSDQAKQLLGRLVKKGQIERHGLKRGAWYGPRP